MKKSTLLFVLTISLITTTIINAQEKYLDRSGVITFEASEKLFEEVKATHKQVTAILNIKTGEIAALVLMKGFRFKNSLMEEHFNENYIESDTYPKAIFKGIIIDFDVATITTEEQRFTTKGILELHGKEKKINTDLIVKKENNYITIKGSFKVTPQDFAIEIPKIVKNKIAKEVIIHISFNLIAK